MTFKLMEGTNIINATVYHKKDHNKVIVSRGHLIHVDPKAPIISENALNIEYDEDADEDEVQKGKIYTNSNKLYISGYDNGEDWRMYVNGDNIESEIQTGQFGNNKREFSTTVTVENGDKLTLETVDKNHFKAHINKAKKVFEVVLDTEAPVITITPEDIENYTGETQLEVEYEDEHPLRKEHCNVMVNGKEYVKGSKLSKYGEDKFFIYAVAVDKAGNQSVKELEVNLSENDKSFEQIALKKNSFSIKELQGLQDVQSLKNILSMPDGFVAKLAKEVDVNKANTKLILEVTNALGIKKILEFEIQIDEFEPEIKAPALKQTHFLPRELKSEQVLFDIPVGMSVEIQPIDASTPGQKTIDVTFFKNSKTLSQSYDIYILPELGARLKKKNLLKNELADVNIVVEADEGFHVKYVKEPNLNALGEQEIAVIISDDYNHSMQMTFKIYVYEKENDVSTTDDAYEEAGEGSDGGVAVPPSVKKLSKDTKSKELKNQEKKDQIPSSKQKSETSDLKEKDEKGEKPALLDVEQHWAKEVIYKAYENEYVKGYPDGSFRPNHPMNRAEFSALSNRVFALPSANIEPNFGDVDPKSWYYQDVARQVANGLMNGVSKTQFNPEKPITRAEVVVIFVRYLEKFDKELLTAYEEKEINASDIEDVPTWATGSIQKAYSMGLIRGDEQNRILPNAPITRAEVVQIIYNFLNIKKPR